MSTTTTFASGSSKVMSSLHFLESGELVYERTGTFENQEDEAALMITQDYLVYALERDDWMIEFLTQLNTSLEKEYHNSQKPNLRLIKGGLAEVTSSQENNK
tara:strand:+ start:655 stop:960 length:306 start_codon:yes stop_codon:yes gene_type:complete